MATGLSSQITEDEEVPEVMLSRELWNDCCELCPTSTSYTSDVTFSPLSCRSESLEVLTGNLANSSGSSSHLRNVFCVPFCALSSHVNLLQRPRTSIFRRPQRLLRFHHQRRPERTQQKKQHSAPSRTPAKICSNPTQHAKSPSAHRLSLVVTVALITASVPLLCQRRWFVTAVGGTDGVGIRMQHGADAGRA